MRLLFNHKSLHFFCVFFCSVRSCCAVRSRLQPYMKSSPTAAYKQVHPVQTCTLPYRTVLHSNSCAQERAAGVAATLQRGGAASRAAADHVLLAAGPVCKRSTLQCSHVHLRALFSGISECNSSTFSVLYCSHPSFI